MQSEKCKIKINSIRRVGRLSRHVTMIQCKIKSGE
jgi:hypothetical protein